MKKPIFVIICFLSVIVAQARTITVDDDGPADFNNIQAAIDDANDGDVVEVQPGVYTGIGNRDLDFGGKAITVRSTNPNEPCVVAATIIDCQGSEAKPHRGFYFHSKECNNSLIEGLTITNGVATVGGGIYCDNSSPTIRKNIITGNYAFNTGEIPGFGGGIFCYESSAIITGNVIIYNVVDGAGGGIFAFDSSLILSNNIITANDANSYIGWFSGSGSGGGICCTFSSLMIVNNTISGNQAHDLQFPWEIPGEGGGIQSGDSSLTIVNTILWSDTPDEINFYGGSTVTTYSDIQGGWPGEGNIDAAPFFADLDNGDYHLKSQAGRWNPVSQAWVIDADTSPCIDAGNPGCPLGDEPNDVNNVRINMGAYGGTAQASKSPANWRSIADLNNDWVVDFSDLSVFVNYWLDSGHYVPGDLNRNQTVDFTDFAIFGKHLSGGYVGEPGVTYEISLCGFGPLEMAESVQTRFTTTVEGSYIHFEDIMVANCCADELWLEMDVTDNLITIYEREYGEYLCTCICDSPVTATLGPFEPGIYTLEVYEDFGGFIGSTTVIIE